MDKVVQQVAATSEESAASSEEMNSQALEMKGIVKELTILVSGQAAASASDDVDESGEPESSRVAIEARTTDSPYEEELEDTDSSSQRQGRHLEWSAKEVNPKQVIPLKDEDFKDF